jgi:hypothetical protein
MPGMPIDGTAPSFTRDIRPLFREADRDSMAFAFDLWDEHDVRAHAEIILQRLAEGTMPCDGEWSDEQIASFRRWVEVGMPA